MIEMIEDIDGIEDIEELVGRMDAEQLRHLVIRMTRIMGVDEAFDAIYDTLAVRNGKIVLRQYTVPPYDDIRKAMASALSGVRNFEYIDYRNPNFDEGRMRNALWDMEKRVACSMVGFYFSQLATDIIETNGEAELGKLVSEIAKALRDADIPWSNTPDDSIEYRKAYADVIEQRFRDGEYDALFEGFDYEDQYDMD